MADCVMMHVVANRDSMSDTQPVNLRFVLLTSVFVVGLVLLAAFTFFWPPNYTTNTIADDDNWRLAVAASSSLGRRGIVRWRSSIGDFSSSGSSSNHEFVGRRRSSGGGQLVWFSGIKYASVKRRFDKSKPINVSTSLSTNGLAWGPNCPSTYHHNTTDDCLTLNIYTCEAHRTRPYQLPVLVVLPEGESKSDSSANLSPAAVERAFGCSMVVVAVHYRHSVFGQMTVDGLDDMSTNRGLDDVTLALHWIHDHIGTFGGNTTRITMLGSRMGAAIADMIARQPLTRHLVSAVILSDGASSRPPLSATPSRAARQSRRLLEAAGCATPLDNFELAGDTRLQKLRECVRRLSKKKLHDLSSRLHGWNKWPLDAAAIDISSSSSSSSSNDGPTSVLLASCRRPSTSTSSKKRRSKSLNIRKLRSRLEKSGELNETLSSGAIATAAAADIELHYLTRYANSTLTLDEAQDEIQTELTSLVPLIAAAEDLSSAHRADVFAVDIETITRRSEFGDVQTSADIFVPCLEHLLFRLRSPPSLRHAHALLVESITNFVYNGSPNRGIAESEATIENDHDDDDTSRLPLDWPAYSTPGAASRSVLAFTLDSFMISRDRWSSTRTFWSCIAAKFGHTTTSSSSSSSSRCS